MFKIKAPRRQKLTDYFSLMWLNSSRIQPSIPVHSIRPLSDDSLTLPMNKPRALFFFCWATATSSLQTVTFSHPGFSFWMWSLQAQAEIASDDVIGTLFSPRAWQSSSAEPVTWRGPSGAAKLTFRTSREPLQRGLEECVPPCKGFTPLASAGYTRRTRQRRYRQSALGGMWARHYIRSIVKILAVQMRAPRPSRQRWQP